MKTGPKKNRSSVKNALVVNEMTILKPISIADDQPISLTIFILLIISRIGHEEQQSPHDRVNLKYTVIFLAPLVHTGLSLADITSTPHNPTLSRYLTWLVEFNLIHHISMADRNGQCEVCRIYGSGKF